MGIGETLARSSHYCIVPPIGVKGVKKIDSFRSVMLVLRMRRFQRLGETRLLIAAGRSTGDMLFRLEYLTLASRLVAFGRIAAPVATRIVHHDHLTRWGGDLRKVRLAASARFAAATPITGVSA